MFLSYIEDVLDLCIFFLYQSFVSFLVRVKNFKLAVSNCIQFYFQNCRKQIKKYFEYKKNSNADNFKSISFVRNIIDHCNRFVFSSPPRCFFNPLRTSYLVLEIGPFYSPGPRRVPRRVATHAPLCNTLPSYTLQVKNHQ